MTDPIRNVSGTAYWIAEYRARETARRYPLVRDPWAAALAGTRGSEVMRALSGSERSAWALIMRTVALDQLVVEGVAEHGFDTVLNLGAGLDTRAYRLPLPKRLRWFDVDTEEIVAHKLQVLCDAPARCDYRALTADLSQDAVRQKIIADVTRASSKTLVITEGLLEYLLPEAVRTLARELHGEAACHTWLCNLVSPIARRSMPGWARKLERVNAPIQFTPEDGAAFFNADGWREADWVSSLAAGMAYRRLPFFARLAFYLAGYMSRETQERVSRIIGVARLERSEMRVLGRGRESLPTSAVHGAVRNSI